jgi:EF-hand domain pair
MDPGSAAQRFAWRSIGATSRGRKILPERQQLPGAFGDAGCKKHMFYWVSRDGTGLADLFAWKQKAAPCGHGRSSVMLLALGAASSVFDALKSLTSSKSSSPPTTGLIQDPANPFDLSGSAASSGSSASGSSAPAFGPGAGAQISPATMSALLDAQSQSSAGSAASAPTSRSDALKHLFAQIDADGDGQLSKTEFENALGAGGTNIAQADDVFGKLDKDGSGSVSLDELSSALKGKGHHHHHAAGGSNGADGSNSDPLAKALQGASSTSVANSDGSTTTSLTYADGSKVTMTSPAATTASSTATSSYNFIEQMIQREAKAISTSATTSLSVSA